MFILNIAYFTKKKVTWLLGLLFILLEVGALGYFLLAKKTPFFVFLGLFVLISFFAYLQWGRSRHNFLRISSVSLLWLAGLICYFFIAQQVVAVLLWLVIFGPLSDPQTSAVPHDLLTLKLWQVFPGGWFLGILILELSQAYRDRYRLFFLLRLIAVAAVPLLFGLYLTNVIYPNTHAVKTSTSNDSRNALTAIAELESPIWGEDSVTLPLGGHLAMKRDSGHILLFGISQIDHENQKLGYDYILLEKKSNGNYMRKARGHGEYYLKHVNFRLEITDNFTIQVLNASTIIMDWKRESYGFLPRVPTNHPDTMVKKIHWHEPPLTKKDN